MISTGGNSQKNEDSLNGTSVECASIPNDNQRHNVQQDTTAIATGRVAADANALHFPETRPQSNGPTYVRPMDLLASTSQNSKEIQHSVHSEDALRELENHKTRADKNSNEHEGKMRLQTGRDPTDVQDLQPLGNTQHLTSNHMQSLYTTHDGVSSSIESGTRVFQVSDLPLRSPSGRRVVAADTSGLTGSTTQASGARDHDVSRRSRNLTIETGRGNHSPNIVSPQSRPGTSRTLSTPANVRSPELTSANFTRPLKPRTSSRPDAIRTRSSQQSTLPAASSMPTSMPLPPLSLPTYLQLELSSFRPSHIYIHRPPSSDVPYESSRAKIERLLNFIFLPPQLEGVLWFGTLACLDSWLYTFTILPLRLLKSFYILGHSWIRNMVLEIQYILAFTVSGTSRMWYRRRSPDDSSTPDGSLHRSPELVQTGDLVRTKTRASRHHHRTKSVPSMLLPDDKADILKGLLIIFTTLVLLKLDASRMYHWVRGQAAIKLYVIYNVLEVCDRLLSAIGQDVLECLFSQETLERKPNGHSKVLRPFWLFILAFAYSIVHSVALFYQVVTLNVAVNSYSNALITLLMSNQFVEIKSTVFKKFEKDNLFQLTCADIVERFQLWHMLVIIAARNIAETGGLNFGISALASPPSSAFTSSAANVSVAGAYIVPTSTASSVISSLFTLVSSLVSSLSAFIPTVSQIMGPFIIVLGSEMLIDWLKHAYISKFNNTRPIIYARFLDILAKDYYTNAFGDQNLTKRLGLPVIPLSCLMIRASVQTYYMFVAAWVPSPSPSATSLASIHELYSASKNALPTSTAAVMVQKVDDLLYQIPSRIVNSELTSYLPTILISLLIFLVLLACKLILGMSLLVFARSRYQKTMERERNPSHHVEGGRRVGGWGVVEVDDDKRRWIYDDDPDGMRILKEREAKEHAKRERERSKGGNVDGLDKVMRYEMVAKRIW